MTCLFDAHVQVPWSFSFLTARDYYIGLQNQWRPQPKIYCHYHLLATLRKITCSPVTPTATCAPETESDGEHPSHLLGRRDDDEFTSINYHWSSFCVHSY